MRESSEKPEMKSKNILYPTNTWMFQSFLMIWQFYVCVLIFVISNQLEEIKKMTIKWFKRPQDLITKELESCGFLMTNFKSITYIYYGFLIEIHKIYLIILNNIVTAITKTTPTTMFINEYC